MEQDNDRHTADNRRGVIHRALIGEWFKTSKLVNYPMRRSVIQLWWKSGRGIFKSHKWHVLLFSAQYQKSISMYKPEKYEKRDPQYIFDFIGKYPFATMVIQGPRLLATHIPILTQGDAGIFRLYGHVANHNEMCQYLHNASEALLIFKSSDAYVSSSWYREADISTWDYSAVHINVKLRIQSQEELEECLKELVERFEKEQERPLYYKDIPEPVLREHLPLITGFWCEPTTVEAVAKLHQSYPGEDVRSVINKLKKQPDANAAQLGSDIERENEGRL